MNGFRLNFHEFRFFELAAALILAENYFGVLKVW